MNSFVKLVNKDLISEAVQGILTLCVPVYHLYQSVFSLWWAWSITYSVWTGKLEVIKLYLHVKGTYFGFRIAPCHKLQFTRLYIKWKILDINWAGRLKQLQEKNHEKSWKKIMKIMKKMGGLRIRDCQLVLASEFFSSRADRQHSPKTPCYNLSISYSNWLCIFLFIYHMTLLLIKK